MERAMAVLRGGRVLPTATALGLLAGVLLFVEGVLAGYAIRDRRSWSWLLVAWIALNPATVATGWTALVLHLRSHPRWLRLTVAAALVETALTLVFAAAAGGPIGSLAIRGVSLEDIEARMVPLGDGTYAIGIFVDLFTLLLMLTVPVLAGVIRVPGRPPRRSLPWHLAAGLAWVGMIAVTYFLIYRVLVVSPS